MVRPRDVSPVSTPNIPIDSTHIHTPHRFDPKRWLDPSQSKALIQDKFQPFSSGARACIATHLVMIEMRLFVAIFFRECAGVRLAPSVTDRSMRILDRFHIAPVTHNCDVIVPGEKA